MDYAERFSRLTIHFQTKETYFFPIFTFFLRIILEFTSKLWIWTSQASTKYLGSFSVSADEGDQEMK